MKAVRFHDADLFYRYDKGYAVASTSLRYFSYQPRESDRYARWFVQAVGDATVPSTQEIGIADYADRTEGVTTRATPRAARTFAAYIVEGKPPQLGWEAAARDLSSGHYQNLGRVLDIGAGDGETFFVVEYVATYDFPAGTYLYFYAPQILATDNLFLPRRAAVRVQYDYPQGTGGPPAAPVAVQRRDARRGKSSEYFCSRVAEIGEGEAVTLDAGYYAFIACPELRDIEVEIYDEVYVHHYNEPPAPFEVIVGPDESPGYLLTAGLACRNGPQDAARRAAPGETTLCKDGSPMKTSEGRVVATRGEVYLGRAGVNVHVGWNDHGFDAATRTWFGQCKLGRFDGAVVHKLFVDRRGPVWFGKPSYELAGGLARWGNVLYGGRRRLDRNWLKTRLRVVWAAPPQGNLPEGYDGGRAAVLLVPGDRTELLRPGDVIRLGHTADGAPAPKEYVIAEAGADVRYLGADNPYSLDDGWRDVTAVFTWAAILEVDYGDLSYDDQVRYEVLGKYISVARGAAARHELWRLAL